MFKRFSKKKEIEEESLSWRRRFWPKRSERDHGSGSGQPSPTRDSAATGDGKTQLIVVVLFIIVYSGSRRLSRVLMRLLKPFKARSRRATTEVDAASNPEVKVEDIVVSRDQM